MQLEIFSVWPVFVAGMMMSYLITAAVMVFANRSNIVDNPDGQRKMHGRPVALLGGFAIFVSLWLLLWYVAIYGNNPFGIERIKNSLGALFFGSALLVAIGITDELRPYSAKKRLALVVLALFATSLFLPLDRITNPSGGWFVLSPVVGSLLVFVWLLTTTLSTKILDGVDGLSTSIVAIGAFIIGCLTLSTRFYQPNVALVAFIVFSVLLGFLAFNLPPARIFLGESGSLLVGFTLGGLAIMAGSKIAIALLVMAVPVLDVVRVAYIRLRKKQPLFVGDREHLHFVLIDRGWSEQRVLALLVGVAVLFGMLGLFLQSYQKVFALLLVAAAFMLFARAIGRQSR